MKIVINVNIIILDTFVASSRKNVKSSYKINSHSCPRRVLEDMNYPANVQFCIDPAHKVFAVRVCRVCDARATVFVKSGSKTGNTLCICNKNLKDSNTTLIKDYDEKLRYKLTGEWDKEHRIMYFDISNAVECEFQPIKRSDKDFIAFIKSSPVNKHRGI